MAIRETISSGDVYVISAGTGFISSTKINPGPKPLKIMEAWLFPSQYSLKPKWAKQNYPEEMFTDKFLPIVISRNATNNVSTLRINQDANFYLSKLGSNNELKYPLHEGRIQYLVNESGKISLNDKSTLYAGDSAKINSSCKDCLIIKSKADESALMMLIDLPKD